jgi:hypothetical protein
LGFQEEDQRSPSQLKKEEKKTQIDEKLRAKERSHERNCDKLLVVWYSEFINTRLKQKRKQ